MEKTRDKPNSVMKVVTPDRVWLTFGQTIQVAQYEPAKVDIGMASDVKPDETPEEAIDRVAEIIQERVASEIRSLVSAKKKRHKE